MKCAAAKGAVAAARAGWQAEGGGQRIEIAGISLWHGRGQAALAGLQAACAAHRIVVIAAPAPAALGPALSLPPMVPTGPAPQCLLIDADLLARTGALALRPMAAGLSITTAALRQGNRPWSPPRR